MKLLSADDGRNSIQLQQLNNSRRIKRSINCQHFREEAPEEAEAIETSYLKVRHKAPDAIKIYG